jgi:hypothetical protein
MSLKPCRHIGLAFAEDMTCGALCNSFPACLPSPSLRLLGEIAQLMTQAANDRQSCTATAQALEAIHKALGIEPTEGEQQ